MPRHASLQTKKTDEPKGFSLLETLIVIGIVSVISAVLIFMLNPGETLRRTRDSQRLSDLKTLERAIGLFIAVNPSGAEQTLCGGDLDRPKLHISFPKDKKGVEISAGACPVPIPPPGAPFPAFHPNWSQVLTDYLFRVDGVGWIPANLKDIFSGSPIATLPVDPVNLINIPVDLEGNNCPDDDDLIYRYTCFRGLLQFEIDARLESREFTKKQDKAAEDGGTNSLRYEVGRALNLLP